MQSPLLLFVISMVLFTLYLISSCQHILLLTITNNLYFQVYCLGTILSMQISFVGFQPVQSSEHMAVSFVLRVKHCSLTFQFCQKLIMASLQAFPSLHPSSRAPSVSLAPKLPFSLPLERLLRRLSFWFYLIQTRTCVFC